MHRTDAFNFSKTILPLAMCLALYGIVAICVMRIPADAYDYAVAFAAPFDLIICVPAAFYFLFVRRNGLTPALVIPVIYTGAMTSFMLVAPGNFTLALPLVVMSFLVEITIAAHEVRRFAATYRTAKIKHNHPLDRFTNAFLPFVKSPQIARMLGMECSIWWYVLCSWRNPPAAPEGFTAFSYHKKSGFVALNCVIMVIGAVEVLAVHLLVSQLNEAMAWVVTLLTLYSFIWLAGNARAVAVNPLLVGDNKLIVQYGTYFHERIPLEAIAETSNIAPDLPKSETVNLATMGATPCWIVLKHPISITTFSGAKKRIRALKVSPDDAVGFKATLKVRE